MVHTYVQYPSGCLGTQNPVQNHLQKGLEHNEGNIYEWILSYTFTLIWKGVEPGWLASQIIQIVPAPVQLKQLTKAG